MREIIFYKNDFGGRPVEEFLDSLDPATRAKIRRTLELLRAQQMVFGEVLEKAPRHRFVGGAE